MPRGPPNYAPVPGARIIIRGSSGAELAAAVTGKQGEYRLSLPPGSYQVDLAPLDFARDLPTPVTISPDGKSTWIFA